MSDHPDHFQPSRHASYMDLFLRLLDSVFLIDRENFSIIEANDACERLLGLKQEELLGKILLDFTLESDREDISKKLRMARRKYYPLEFEARLNSGSTGGQAKSLAVRISACSLKLVDNSEVLQVIAKDVTREKDALEKNEAYMRELKMLNAKLEQLSITDELTKLSNVRHFRQKIKEEHERASRYAGKYSLIMFDVDNFKFYNDTHGHPAGDLLLKTLGKLFNDNCRNTDFSARYGGEEFVILCPEVNSESALVNAERYRKLIESYPFPFSDQQPLGKVSVSIGVASYPDCGHTQEDIVKAADEALYVSKQNGRNRSTLASQLSQRVLPAQQNNKVKKGNFG